MTSVYFSGLVTNFFGLLGLFTIKIIKSIGLEKTNFCLFSIQKFWFDFNLVYIYEI